jgi:LAS superfamily LD-carboxypeptidase LdcB
MEMFSHHELIQNPDGYTLVLYVEKQTSEFAKDFSDILDSDRKELSKDTLDHLKSYINDNYRGIKISTVNIVVGSLLVASIAYSSFAEYTPSIPSTIREQLNTQGQESSPISKAPVKSSAGLILVNKSHSLPVGYVPVTLTTPDVPSSNRLKTKMTPEAAEALEALFAKAKRDNIKLTAISGYRSYERQNSIFASNINKYGSVDAANQFSAKPGQSEHQTGLAMDISSPSVNYTLSQSYAQTREGKWLKENAPHFGFIIRYPKGKEGITGYQFEPWHIRYVGESAALEIANSNITLEEYLGKIS